MARKKKAKETLTSEQIEHLNLERDLSDLRKSLHLISEPTKVLNIGDEVTVGSLEDVFIQDILENGKIYLINFTSIDHNYGNSIRNENQKRYVKWTDVRLKNNNTASLIQNYDLKLSYSQAHMTEILSKAYYFGIDFIPDYQRDYVWELEDKIELIDSIFNNVDIGKFVFIRISDEDWAANGHKYGYEILDGKQRIRAILDYYEDRFTYKGKLFSELSIRDQNYFKGYHINVAEMDKVTEEQALRYFLKLNVTGKAMNKEHLDKIRGRLEKLESR